MTTRASLIESSRPFLSYLEEWYASLPNLPLEKLIDGEPERVIMISVDIINGFCKGGPLASERVGQLAQPIADLFQHAYDLGVRHFALTQDTHDPHTPEFDAYPPHCVRGTDEAEAVDELKALPFFESMAVFPKNALNSHILTGLDAWIAAHPQADRFVVVGDCTDLCTYSSAMQLRMEANARNISRRVVVPADVVNTFDTPVHIAREHGIKAHDADLHHVLFLHHMAMNGVEVVGSLG